MSFTYNDEGIRTSKTVNGVTTTYYLYGSQIVGEETNGNVTLYLYDSTGLPIGMQYHASSYAAGQVDVYWFERNLQGDVVAVYDVSGTKLISYTYDAWGYAQRITYHNGASSTHPAAKNPFRYRGYYYDADLRLYYLNSRYYDPFVCRFISADSMISANNGSIHGYNQFVYCFNNPVMQIDDNGEWPRWVEKAAKVASAVVVVVATVATVTAVSAFTAGTGTATAVYLSSVFLGAALSGINGAVANESEGNSYLNGYIGGATGGVIQSVCSKTFVGTIAGGAIGVATGTAVTATLNNLDPDSNNSTTYEIVDSALRSGSVALVTSSVTAYVGYASNLAVSNAQNSIMPTYTYGFGEAVKSFFGWADDALVYVWE